MNWKGISFGILCLVLLFQFKNISSFIAVELALKGIKELDVNSDDVIDKSEWPGIGFSIVDVDRNNLLEDEEIRFFIKEFSKDFSWVNKVSDRINVPEQLIHSTSHLKQKAQCQKSTSKLIQSRLQLKPKSLKLNGHLSWVKT